MIRPLFAIGLAAMLVGCSPQTPPAANTNSSILCIRALSRDQCLEWGHRWASSQLTHSGSVAAQAEWERRYDRCMKIPDPLPSERMACRLKNGQLDCQLDL